MIKLIEHLLVQKEDLDFVMEDLTCLTTESIEGVERVKEITQALKGYSYSGEKSTFTDINECVESTLKMVWNELKYNCSVKKNLGNIPQMKYLTARKFILAKFQQRFIQLRIKSPLSILIAVIMLWL